MWSTRRLIRLEVGSIGRRDALSKGVGNRVRPVDLSRRCGPVSAQGRARLSTPGIVHRRSWHSTTGGWVSRTHVGRVGGDAASSPRPAGDDAGRGRLCTTLRRDGLQLPENVDGSHTVAHPLGQRVARFAGRVRAGSSDALPTSTPAATTICLLTIVRRFMLESCRCVRCGWRTISSSCGC